MLVTVLTVVQVFAAIGVIALVLLQRGRGADAGAGFGAGASATVFGARGATTGLSRATAVLAAVFMLNSLALAYLGSRAPAAQSQGLLETGGTTSQGAAVPAPNEAALPAVESDGATPPAATPPAATPPIEAPIETAPAQ